MAKDLKISFLLDFYGEMLTQKQREVIEYYYNDDLSLAEIATMRGSRVRACGFIKRAEAQLLEMEERLGLARRFREMQAGLEQITKGRAVRFWTATSGSRIRAIFTSAPCSSAIRPTVSTGKPNSCKGVFRWHLKVLPISSQPRSRAISELSESDIKEAMREVRLALLEADVNYKVAKEFTARVSERAVGAEVMESLTPAQMVVKIVNEELTRPHGRRGSRLASPSSPPAIVMLCGLQGAGKTTHCAKLALMLKSKGHRPLLVAADVYRPAAVKQLQVLGSRVGVPVFERGTEEKPVEICREAVRRAKDYGNDFVIIDTAGRLQIDEALMDELGEIKEKIAPHEILLTVDAMTGQEAVNVAKAFDEKLSITGVILTKLDGDTRGGAALSVRSVTGKPIKFAGVGEKLEDLEVFHPDRMASRILGMGDVLTLIEEAQMKIDQKEAEKMSRKLLQNKLDFNDLLAQFAQVKRWGRSRTSSISSPAWKSSSRMWTLTIASSTARRP